MTGGSRRAQLGWSVTALAVFAFATLHTFSGLVGQDPTVVVPANVVAEAAGRGGVGNWDSLAETDLRFVVWLISRNAWTLVHRPLSLFDAEQCFPARNTLALGESGIALGALAAPIRLVVGDPIATFNATLIAMTALAALSMFLLVRAWTGSPAAAIVAGLLYAFHVLKIGDVVHVIVWDTAWTVFALHFATRLFRERRWRDAAGLALAVALQIAGSLYPLLAAGVIALPFLIWLLLQHGPARAPRAQLALVSLVAIATSLAVLGPYLRGSAAGDIEQVPFQVYRPLSYLLPGGDGFSGWVVLGLALASLLLGRKRSLTALGADPRWALLVGGVLIFAMSVVGEGSPGQATFPVVRGSPPPAGFPNLYLALTGLLPSLDVVRGPGAMYGGVHLVLCLLAGLGAAALLASVPRRFAPPLAALLIVGASIDTLRPSFAGLAPRIEHRMTRLRPSDDALALFGALERRGDRGPLLEFPVKRLNLWKASEGLLLTAYHERPTSYCYNSFFPSEIEEVERISATLPEASALAELYEMGFRTVVVHHEPGSVDAGRRSRRFEHFAAARARAAPDSGATLEKLEANASLSAYRIRP